jgi:hypothetical protein
MKKNLFILLFSFNLYSQSVTFTYEGSQLGGKCTNQGCNNSYEQSILPIKLIKVDNGKIEDAAIVLHELYNLFFNLGIVYPQNCNNLNFRKCNFIKTEKTIKETVTIYELDLNRIYRGYGGRQSVYEKTIVPLTTYWFAHPNEKKEFDERGKKYEKDKLEKLEAEKKAQQFAEEQRLLIEKKKKEEEEQKIQNEFKIYKEKLNKLQSKPLSKIEKFFVGNWKFKSNDIFLNNGEITKMEEVWLVNPDRTYKYESRYKKFMEDQYYGNYHETGIFEIEEDSFGNIYVVANIIEENNKPSSRIDKMKFEEITEKKAKRIIVDKSAKYPFKLIGKKTLSEK